MAKTPAVAAGSAPATLPTLDAFEEYAGAGLEKVTAADLLVPRLVVIQALSPQIDESEPEYIEGAKVGDICDVGTGKLFKQGVVFLPCYYRMDWLEWAPRASGKGLVGVHSSPAILDQCVRDERKRPILPNGNLISETAQFFGLNMSANRQKCFIPMASTQLKKGRKWLTQATGEILTNAAGREYQAPLFYRVYQLGTADESNNDGKWKGWSINQGPALPELSSFDHPSMPAYTGQWTDLLKVASEFRDSLIRGEHKADVSDLGRDVTEEAGEGRM